MALTIYRVCAHFWTELWRRFRLEFTVEWPMLIARWKTIFACIVLQYVHGIFAQLAHRVHKPLAHPLVDLGFMLLPELGEQRKWVSEAMFLCLVFVFILWSFSPFVVARKRFYTVVLYTRILVVLVTCQALRVMAFSVTRLPAPNYHCRAGQATSMRAWPKHWWEHLIFDMRRTVMYSCGDLIFSSHTTFCLTGSLAYNEYGSWLPVKVLTWIAVGIVSLTIIASRKHYTVDVLVAWWTVPLVFYAHHRRWTISRPVMSEGEGDAETWEGVGSSSRQLAGDRPEISSGIRSSRGPSMVEMVTSTGGSHSMPSGSMSAQNLSELGEVSNHRGRALQMQLHAGYARDPEKAQLSQGDFPQTPGKDSDLCRIS